MLEHALWKFCTSNLILVPHHLIFYKRKTLFYLICKVFYWWIEHHFIQHTSPMKKRYWYFLIPPSGPASGSRRCWKMESWGPGVHSFEAFHIISGYFVQYARPLKRHYQYFLILPSGPASGTRRCWKMESWIESMWKGKDPCLPLPFPLL